mgnify:CR=1 FL=1
MDGLVTFLIIVVWVVIGAANLIKKASEQQKKMAQKPPEELPKSGPRPARKPGETTRPSRPLHREAVPTPSQAEGSSPQRRPAVRGRRPPQKPPTVAKPQMPPLPGGTLGDWMKEVIQSLEGMHPEPKSPEAESQPEVKPGETEWREPGEIKTAVKTPPAPVMARYQRVTSHRNPLQLREDPLANAILVAEILAPPLALRHSRQKRKFI